MSATGIVAVIMHDQRLLAGQCGKGLGNEVRSKKMKMERRILSEVIMVEHIL